jgi:hypothetical protein
MTGEQPRRRAADDVAKDMRRRLDELDEHVHDAERQVAAIPPNPLSGIAGDPEAIPEGPRSGGGTLGRSRRQPEPPQEGSRSG